MNNQEEEIISLRQQLKLAQDALLILNYYNMIHNDFEDYLLRVSEWGLGEGEIPNPDSFVTGLTQTEVLVKQIRDKRK